MPIWSAEIKELEKLYESLKGQLPVLEKELGHLIKADDENVILLYSRRCLEVIITDLCECELKRDRGTEPLKGIIDKLNKERKVPSHIVTSMQGLNELSTYGTHPKDFDPEQVKPVLNNLDIIIKWYLKYRESQAADQITSEEAKIQFGKIPEYGRRNELKESHREPIKSFNQKLLSRVLIAIILVIAAIFVYPKIFKQDRLERLRASGKKISVAVLPFQNMTNDTSWNIWQIGVQDMLITSLSNSSGDFMVRQRESINNLIQNRGIVNYASITPAFAGSISQKLDAKIFIYGNLLQAGPTLRVHAQLIDAETEEVFKSFQIEDSTNEENIFTIIDSLSKMVRDFLIVSNLIKEGNPATIKFEATTRNPDAFKYVISGNKAFFGKSDFPTAISMYMKAFELDSTYFYPAIMISYAYWNQYLYEQGKEWCMRIYEKKDQLPEIIRVYADIVHAMYFESPYESIRYLRRLLEIDDQLPDTYTDIGFDYNRLKEYPKAIPELEKALEIYNKWRIKPLWSTSYINLGIAYRETRQYKKANALYKKAEEDFTYDLNLTYHQCLLALVEGDTLNYNKYLEKALRIAKEESWTDVNSVAQMAAGFSEIRRYDMAEEYYRKALSLEPAEPGRMNDLAFLLIDSELNIPEGMELVSRAIETDPENYKYLDCKGWGLYKLGRYKEALDFIQRSWDQKPVYRHEIFQHLEAAKKAVARQKN